MVGSLGYAERLKTKRKLGGQLGATEYMEDVATVQQKVDQLADMIRNGNKLFFFTGAGISTAAGIPDFRGPTGIWTLKKKKLPISAPLTPFEHAAPTLTHMVISGLMSPGQPGSLVCSQNVDSLHLRSGVPRSKMAELHGNCFAERCSTCKSERVRDFQIETLDFKPTGRVCHVPGCGGVMVDNVLDWESALPDDELQESVEAAAAADVCLVLGSSLQISPANEIPLLTADAGGKVVIVNLQKTPRDRRASLIIRAKVDAVMARLAQVLGLPIPPYVRMDGIVVCHCALQSKNSTRPALHSSDFKEDALQQADSAAGQHKQEQAKVPGNVSQTVIQSQDESDNCWGSRLMVRSVHGQECMLPMVESVQVTLLPDDSGLDSQRAAPRIHVVSCIAPERAQQQEDVSQGKKSPPGSGSASKRRRTVSGSITTATPGHESAQDEHGGVPSTTQRHAHSNDNDGDERRDGPPASSTSSTAVAVSPSVSGGVPLGGPYEFAITDIPNSMDSITCSIRLRLVEWADADKRDVVLPLYTVTQESVAQCETSSINCKEESGSVASSHHVQLGAGQADALEHPSDDVITQLMDTKGVSLPCQSPSAAVQGTTPPDGSHSQDTRADNSDLEEKEEMQKKKESQDVQQQIPGMTGPTSSEQTACELCSSGRVAVYTFVTQEAHYDAAAAWQSYVDNPPAVVLPAVKKDRKQQSSTTADEAVTGPVRRSGRATKPSSKAKEARQPQDSDDDDEEEEDDDDMQGA